MRASAAPLIIMHNAQVSKGCGLCTVKSLPCTIENDRKKQENLSVVSIINVTFVGKKLSRQAFERHKNHYVLLPTKGMGRVAPMEK